MRRLKGPVFGARPCDPPRFQAPPDRPVGRLVFPVHSMAAGQGVVRIARPIAVWVPPAIAAGRWAHRSQHLAGSPLGRVATPECDRQEPQGRARRLCLCFCCCVCVRPCFRFLFSCLMLFVLALFYILLFVFMCVSLSLSVFALCFCFCVCFVLLLLYKR